MPLAEQPISRCKWATDVTEEERLYHDTEWGVPLYDDNKLFELLILEGAQAGLSWKTILLKRESYRELFAAFDPVKVAAFSDAHCAALCQDARIIRHHGKIKGAVTNAKAFLAVQAEFGSFAKYIWRIL